MNIQSEAEKTDSYNKKAVMIGMPVIDAIDDVLTSITPGNSGIAVIPKHIKKILSLNSTFEMVQYDEVWLHNKITDISENALCYTEIRKFVVCCESRLYEKIAEAIELAGCTSIGSICIGKNITAYELVSLAEHMSRMSRYMHISVADKRMMLFKDKDIIAELIGMLYGYGAVMVYGIETDEGIQPDVFEHYKRMCTVHNIIETIGSLIEDKAKAERMMEEADNERLLIVGEIKKQMEMDAALKLEVLEKGIMVNTQYYISKLIESIK